MPIFHFKINNDNKSDDRLIGYSIDVETAANFEPDIPALCDWVQNIALGVMIDGWTLDYLLEEGVNILIANQNQIVIVDTINNRKPMDSA